MGRGGKLAVESFVEIDGETIPYLNKDRDGKLTWFVSEEKQKEIEQTMLKNIGTGMSLFYKAHPEYIKGVSI